MDTNKTIKENDGGDGKVYNTSQAQIEAVLRSQQYFYAYDEEILKPKKRSNHHQGLERRPG